MITAVVTYYNKPEHILKRCIDSLERFGIDYIIVDDCSGSSFLNSYKNVISLDENLGHYRAFEIGLKEVKTEFVMKIDADDYITFRNEIFGDYDAYINNIRGKISLDPKVYTTAPYGALGGSIIKRDVLVDVWSTNLKYCNDIVIFTRLICKYKCTFFEKCNYVYDTNYSSIVTMKNRNKYVIEARKLAREELKKGCGNG